MTGADQGATVEFRAHVSMPGRFSFMVQRRGRDDLDAVVEMYRGFGYDVEVEQRECGPWVAFVGEGVTPPPIVADPEKGIR